MKIQAVKFPSTPEEAEQKIEELRPLLNAFFYETEGGNADKFPTQMLVMLWHSFMLDFIEVLDDQGNRIGLTMVSIIDELPTERRSASVTASYVVEEHRGKGLFKSMMSYIKTVYQARSFSHITLNSKQRLDWFGVEHSIVYKEEL